MNICDYTNLDPEPNTDIGDGCDQETELPVIEDFMESRKNIIDDMNEDADSIPASSDETRPPVSDGSLVCQPHRSNKTCL